MQCLFSGTRIYTSDTVAIHVFSSLQINVDIDSTLPVCVSGSASLAAKSFLQLKRVLGWLHQMAGHPNQGYAETSRATKNFADLVC